MAENYDLIFGQGASSQYAWSDSDYQKGWQTVGSTPPTAEQFDALQRRSDTKAKDLNNRLSPLETTASKALARVTPAANRLPYFNSSNSATTTAISDFIKTLLDDKDAATARATLGAPSTTGANASGSWNINAAAATKLATARKIGGVSFDGSADITLPGVNAAGTQNTSGKATTAGTADTAKACSGNAATATKLAAARKINITGNATGAAAFDGSGDISINTTVNESKHAAAATTVKATAPNGGEADLAFGNMAATDSARIRVYGKDDKGALEIATADGGNEPIYARQYVVAYDESRRLDETVMNEAAILDGNGNTKFPKNVTAARFTGPLNGNASSATTAGNVSNKIYYSSDSPSVATDKLFVVKQAHQGDDHVPNNGLVIQTGFSANNNGKLYITDNGKNGVWIGGIDAGKEVDWTRLVENKGTWGISISGNAATATKLATARKINITGNATGASTFDGTSDVSINVTVNSATKATNDGNGANIANTYVKKAGDTTTGKITFESTDLNALPEVKKTFDDNMSGIRFSSKTKFLGAVGKRLSNGEDLLNLRSDNTSTDVVLDSRNYNSYAPTKTGGGASGTWGISISGNAATATKLATARSIALTGNATGSATFDGSGNISISTNVNTATNADKLDGAHLADVYRQVGGHNTPTITSIIDWNTMKACNGGTDVRNINNTTYGVTAYGGDSNFSSGVLNGYAKGSFYLTQDYTNFDKLCFLFCSDTGEDIEYTMTDVFLLNYIMTNYSVVNLSHDDNDFWIVTGYSNKGTAKDKVSTKRIFSAPASLRENNCGIVDVLGIKY